MLCDLSEMITGQRDNISMKLPKEIKIDPRTINIISFELWSCHDLNEIMISLDARRKEYDLVEIVRFFFWSSP